MLEILDISDIVLGLAIASPFASALVIRNSRKNTEKAARSIHSPRETNEWRVKVGPSIRREEYDSVFTYGSRPSHRMLDDEISVRVRKSNDENMTIGSVKLNAENFEEQLGVLTRKAEERAAALNAIAEEYI
jgi:hypothetical protein